MALEIAFLVTALILIACLGILRAKGAGRLKRPWRFSLRDMLVGMTLVAALLGIIAYAISTADKDEPDRFDIESTEWFERHLEKIESGRAQYKAGKTN